MICFANLATFMYYAFYSNLFVLLPSNTGTTVKWSPGASVEERSETQTNGRFERDHELGGAVYKKCRVAEYAPVEDAAGGLDGG